MKKTISILTILSLVCVTGCTAEQAKKETVIVEVKTPGQLAQAAEKVQHPAANFDKQVESGIVILDFFAVWCPPCKRFSPVFIKAASDNTDKLFIKIDIEQYAEITNKYGVQSMPTIIALKDGKEIKRNVGGMSEAQFKKWLNDLK